MYNLIAQAAPVAPTTGPILFVLSLIALAGIFRYFIGANAT